MGSFTYSCYCVMVCFLNPLFMKCYKIIYHFFVILHVVSFIFRLMLSFCRLGFLDRNYLKMILLWKASLLLMRMIFLLGIEVYDSICGLWQLVNYPPRYLCNLVYSLKKSDIILVGHSFYVVWFFSFSVFSVFLLCKFSLLIIYLSYRFLFCHVYLVLYMSLVN